MRQYTPRHTGHASARGVAVLPRAFTLAARAFTLAEALVSLSILTVLLIGMQSAIMLAGKAMPDANPLAAQVVDGRRAQDVVAADLAYATNILDNTKTSEITVEVADRDGDKKPEVIRFYWPGPDSSLMRVYNGVESVVAKDVRDFKLKYITRTVSKTQVVSTEVEDTADKEVGGNPVYTGATSRDFTVAGAASTSGEMKGWAAQYFKLKGVPLGATKVRFTRAEVWLKTYSGGLINITIGGSDPTISIYNAAGTSTTPVVGTLVGGAARISRSGLPSSYGTNPVGATLPDGTTSTKVTGGAFYVVVKGHDSTNPAAYLRYVTHTNPPPDLTHMEWSTNGGSAWQPTLVSNRPNQDMTFRVYGRYTTGTTAEVTSQTHYLTAVGMTLNGSDEAQSRLDTAVQVLNEPRVNAP